MRILRRNERQQKHEGTKTRDILEVFTCAEEAEVDCGRIFRDSIPLEHSPNNSRAGKKSIRGGPESGEAG